MLCFFGGWACGSAVWGWVAGRAGIPLTLSIASVGLVVGLATGIRYKLKCAENLDLTPSAHWPEPKVVTQAATRTGAVLVTIEYQIDPEDAEAFTQAARASGVSGDLERDDLVRILDRLAPLQFVDGFHPVRHFTPDGVLAIEKIGICEADEELTVG